MRREFALQKISSALFVIALALGMCVVPASAYAEDDTSQDSGVEVQAPSYDALQVTDASGEETQAVHIGESFTVTPELSGDASAVTFNYVWSYEGGWDSWSSTIKETGTTTADASWEFTPAKAGSYNLYVGAYLSDGSVVERSATVQVLEDWSCAGFSMSASEVELGESVTVTPTVTGDDAAYAQFNYVWNYANAWDEWSSTVKETGANTSDASWVFTPARAGSYSLHVDAVRTDGTKVTFDAELTVHAEWEATGLTVLPESMTWGDQSQVTVDFAEGSNVTGLTFNYVWSYEGGWDSWSSTVKETGSRTSDATWTFDPPAIGSYVIYVDVVGTDGTQVTLEGQVEVKSPFEIEGLDVSDESIPLGGSVRVTPQLSGDTSGATFNYVWSHEGGWDDWSSTVKETGAATADASWTFQPTMWGSYTLYVDVIGPDGSTLQCLSKTFEVQRGWDVDSMTVSAGSSMKVGDSSTYSIAVSGDRASQVVFNFVWQRDGWADWDSTEKSTGEDTTATQADFNPKHSGSYTLYVDAIDTQTGQRVTSSQAVSVSKTWSLSKLSLNYSSPLRSGASVTWTAVVEGDTSGLKYNFVWQRDNWSAWNSTMRANGSYTSSSSVTYQIGSTGSYSFYVDVVDENGEVEQASVSGITCRATKAEAIDAITGALYAERGNSNGGYKYENKLIASGGYLCNGRHGWWCANYIWYCFDKAGYRYLWGITNHLQADPEYLAWDYSYYGHYSSSLAGVQRGDIIFSYWNPWRSGQTITHASYVLSVSGSSITVIEGNMPGGVVVNTYSRYSSIWRGYARVQY